MLHVAKAKPQSKLNSHTHKNRAQKHLLRAYDSIAQSQTEAPAEVVESLAHMQHSFARGIDARDAHGPHRVLHTALCLSCVCCDEYLVLCMRCARYARMYAAVAIGLANLITMLELARREARYDAFADGL